MKYRVTKQKDGRYRIQFLGRRPVPGMPTSIRDVEREDLEKAVADLIEGTYPEEVRPQPTPGA